MTDQPTNTERTVAFYTDPRAATLLLKETIAALITSTDIQRGLVDLSTVSGLAIAEAFHEAGVPFDSLEFGQEDRLAEGPPTDEDADEVRQAADGIKELEIEDLGTIDANIVVVPYVTANGVTMDFTKTTVLGTVISQIEQAERQLLLVLPPERGLRPIADGMYQRAIVHVEPTSDDV